MTMDRRDFMLATGAGALLSTLQATAKPAGATSEPAWSDVRSQFALAPDVINLALFYLVSHPRPVRDAIQQHRALLDANPHDYVEKCLFGGGGDPAHVTAAKALATYLGARHTDIAFTGSTTEGLALVFQGLSLKPGDEVLTTTHDHFVQHESIRMAVERAGATWRRVPLFQSSANASVDEIVTRVRSGIAPATRVLGITWVHSSSGMKLPLKAICDAVADVNRSRDEKTRVLVVVDGVHGLGAEPPEEVLGSGCDVFVSGLHKWMLAPRGTGIVWSRAWDRIRATVPSFTAMENFVAWAEERPAPTTNTAAQFSPGGFHAFEHTWAIGAAVDWHRSLGPARITARIHELNGTMRRELAAMPHVTVHTPKNDALSAGIVCFEVKGLKPAEVVKKLAEKRIVATTSPYRVSYARVSAALANNEADVLAGIKAIKALGSA